ncbi:MAG: type II secretion system protein GspG [Myxococcota bacterium]
MNRKARRILRRARRGMTLIEIMVVIVLLALLMGLVGVALIPKLEEGKRDSAMLQMKNFEGALKCFYVKKGSYPDTGVGLKGLVDTQCMETIPQDPWGSEYVYLNEGGKPVIVSYAKDKAPGGEGNDADLSTKDGPKPQ